MIRIGSRGSDLALWQANFVQSELKKIGVESTITIIKTRGDQIQNLSFEKMEGKGFFTKEIEDALLNDEIDLAIHSCKDLETSEVPGLTISAYSYRENPTDAILCRKDVVDGSRTLGVTEGITIGTSSARRKAQIYGLRPDLKLKDLRGNVPTRIEKLRSGEYDAIVLASAGIQRLNLDLSDIAVIEQDPQEFVPAPAQGVLGLQTREGDNNTIDVVKQLNHPEVQQLVLLEREVLRLFSGGCQLPLGAYCTKNEEGISLLACLGNEDGSLNRVHLSSKDATLSLAQEAVDQLKKKDLK